MAAELPGLRPTHVLLRRMGARWLTHDEIADAVVRAVEEKPERLEWARLSTPPHDAPFGESAGWARENVTGPSPRLTRLLRDGALTVPAMRLQTWQRRAPRRFG